MREPKHFLSSIMLTGTWENDATELAGFFFIYECYATLNKLSLQTLIKAFNLQKQKTLGEL